MQSYTLDLRTLLPLLEEGGQTGRLTSALPSGIPGRKEPCQAEILLQEGKLVSCSVKARNGLVLVSGRQAMQVLVQLRTREWQLEDIQRYEPPPLPAAPVSQSPPERGYFVPRRVAQVDTRVLTLLSRPQRRILNLVDGIRGIDKITLLHAATIDQQSIQQVIAILQELERLQLIIIP